jgi:DNA polymerase III subunit alpha
MPDFCHLHCHTQFSLLDGASDIKGMISKAVSDGQKAVAITDHGNMFGAFKFVSEAKKQGIKPIVGCEFYMVENRHKQSFKKSAGEKDERFHQLMLAKNEVGYKNLSKLCSLGFIEGHYDKYPRIDKELILQYHEGIIATSCCIGAEIPQAILKGDMEKAEKLLKWWLDIFGEDYYIELQRQRGMGNIDGSGISLEDVNQKLMELAKKYNVKTIATNDSHYINEDDAPLHDVLLCVNTGSLLEEEKRFKFPSNDFYFKNTQEMNQMFHDLPHAIDNTMEIASKVSELNLARDILLPQFPMPPQFRTQDEYLRHLSFEGAKRRWGTLSPSTEERLNFELSVIENSGYAGYFLIVQDFTTTARNLGVSVGPGRGSAAGSAVAYCLGITNIDPIRYDLLFERFLNPERISMPDIDIDFDDEGRSKVLDYVIEKYGKNQVAQIITYGSMAAKSALRDVGRVMNIPLKEVDVVAKTFPNHLDATLAAVLEDRDISSKLKEKLNSEEQDKAYKFRELAEKNDDIGKMIKTAKGLEGSIRNTGVHACGVIITPGDITEYVPVALAKDSNLLLSQFDNSVAEDAGLLKMDFLGLKTLTIIKDAVEIIRQTKGIELDIDSVDLEDAPTYQLFQQGDTIAIFQYESPGMQKYLKELKPTKFEDLIAMNALYRPGPLQYIPQFIRRKNGIEQISYDLDATREYLEETYGITVYQEQVMLLSQKLADFSKGEADVLRKAMGKKQKEVLDKMKSKFINQAIQKGHPEEILEKIWKDWEAFASYAFNKSHSTCYAYIAFQTAYLKAHYPVEFMAAVLNNNKNDISKLKFFLDEATRKGIAVLGPDVNESKLKFSVNKAGQIRFGLSALKGVGEGPVEEIVSERSTNGPYKDVFDLVKRVNLRTVNKKVLDSLVMGGAFDSFTNMHRAQYFAPTENHDSFIELILRFGNAVQQQKNSMQGSLFGNVEDLCIDEPNIPACEEWIEVEKLEKEKEITGIYLSGHPLDQYRMEFKYFVNCPINIAEEYKDKVLKLGGIVVSAAHFVSNRGTNYGRVLIQDYTSTLEISLYKEKYESFKHLLTKGNVLFIEGKFSKGYNNDQYSFRVNDIRLMDSIAEIYTKSMTVKLPVQQLNEGFIDHMSELFSKHKGKHPLYIRLYDQDDEVIYVDTIYKNNKIQVSYELIKELEQYSLAYKIN